MGTREVRGVNHECYSINQWFISKVYELRSVSDWQLSHMNGSKAGWMHLHRSGLYMLVSCMRCLCPHRSAFYRLWWAGRGSRPCPASSPSSPCTPHWLVPCWLSLLWLLSHTDRRRYEPSRPVKLYCLTSDVFCELVSTVKNLAAEVPDIFLSSWWRPKHSSKGGKQI